MKTVVPQMYKNGFGKSSHGDHLLLHAELTVTNALLLFPRCFALTSSFSIQKKGGKVQ